jgi:hypothetical protein
MADPTAPVRVAGFLLELVSRHSVGARIDLPMSRRGMADHLDLPVEVLCRVLTLFAEARLIAIPNVSQVEITDIAALETITHSN